MIRGLFGSESLSARLRGGLEETAATQRLIGQRVARSLESSANVRFQDAVEAQLAQARQDEADLQRNMAALADTQLRYEADAQLLKEVYQRLRTAISSRG
jgi:flagellar basal body rod protein FlgB